ncbi:MAG: AAA family ATPase [Pirellulaceae bacterium]|nr:AAA family ATPase [Pirellulaceae bacterium]
MSIPMTTIRPNVIMLAGPNGAGKTTSSRSLLADQLKVVTFVNADIIAQGLSGFDPESAAWEASRIMLERLDELAEKRQDFAFETTLAARSYARRITNWRGQGYCFQLYYFWLPNSDLAVRRVADRVQQGGHHVPEETVRHRYRQSLRNLFELYMPLADAWNVYLNERRGSPQLIARGSGKAAQLVADQRVWEMMRKGNES